MCAPEIVRSGTQFWHACEATPMEVHELRVSHCPPPLSRSLHLSLCVFLCFYVCSFCRSFCLSVRDQKSPIQKLTKTSPSTETETDRDSEPNPNPPHVRVGARSGVRVSRTGRFGGLFSMKWACGTTRVPTLVPLARSPWASCVSPESTWGWDSTC